MRKKLIVTLSILCLLATLLSACGKKEKSFQGTITDITDNIVSITPDPGAEILEKADSVWFDAAELEDLQAKPGDSVYVTYNKVSSSKEDGTSIRVISWQMMIRAPENVPDSANIWKDSSDNNVTVTGEDGAFLTATVADADWQNAQVASDPSFGIRINGVSYGADLYLEDCVWQCVLTQGDNTAVISGQDALTIAGIYQASGLSVPGWQEVDPASGTKTTTTGLNLRSLPSTDGTVMTTVPAGTALTVTGQTDGWYQILYDAMTLYASADYLS